MSINFNSAVTKLKGAAPWKLSNVVVGSRPVFLYAYGLSDGDKVCVRRIVTGGDETGFVSTGCATNQPIPGSVVARSDVNACGTPVCMDKDNASVQLPEPGDYELVGEGPGFAAGTVIIEEMTWTGEHSPVTCPEPIDIGSIPDLVIAELPDLVVAELPDLVVAELPDLVVAELPDLIVAELPDLVVKELPDVVISEIPDLKIAEWPALVVETMPELTIAKHVVDTQVVCNDLWYIWSDGTKTTEALPVCPPAFCPSIRLNGGGYGFHEFDLRDPAATVVIAPCPGDTSVDPIYIYPTAAPGRTARQDDCDGNLIGYGVNKSDCAADCGCPKDPVITVNNSFKPTTNVAAPTVNVAAPEVTNNFAPTTNVAAPNVTLPAPNLVAHALSDTGVLTSTLSNGQTVVSNPLPSC